MKMRSTLLNTFLLLMMASVAFLMSCNKDDDEDGVQSPVADFSFEIDDETGGIVTFTNTSENADEFLWDFGDETTSTQENPVKTYMEDGDYEVTLTATGEGGSDETSQTVSIILVVDMTDTEAPEITLEGDAEVSIEIGSEYTDAGATANDNVDGDISDDIEVTGEVNTLQPGEYTLAYNVSDAAGNAATEVTRTVTVTYDEGLLTNGDFEDGATAWTVNFGDPQVPEIQEDGGNKFFFANVESAGDAFAVNLSQVLEIGDGNTYKLSFNASTGEDNTRDIIAGIGLNEAPFTNVSESITLSDQTQRFELEFTANFGSTNSRILFDMGADVGIVVIDNVSLELTEEAEESTAALPLDFESDDQIFEVFNGASFELAADPENGDNQVGKVTNVGAAFEGISLDLGTDVDFSSDKQITIQFNTSQSGVPVLLKFENGSAGDVETTATASTTGWQELTFDFGSASGSYSTITLFVDGPGTTSGDFYIDDITQSSASGGTGGCAGDLIAASNLPVDFEGCETFLSSQNFGTGISSEIATNPSKDATNGSDYVLKVEKNSGADFFAGIQNKFPEGSSNPLDFTDDVLKLKVYSSKANVVFRFELLLDPNPNGDGNPAPKFVTIENANEWTEVEVEFTGFPVSPDAYNKLVIKPDNDQSDSPITEDGTYYIDDITTGPSSETGTPGEYCATQVTHFAGNAGSEALLTIESVTRMDGFPALKFTIATDPTNGKVPDNIIVNSLEGGAGLEAMDTSVDGEVSIEAFWPSGAPANNETNFNVLWSFEGEPGNWQLFETPDTKASLDATCE